MNVPITRKAVNTFTATIFVGADIGAVGRVCQAYCDENGLCVTVTPTRYVYTDGAEDGAAIGLIHYPRFPSSPDAIRRTAITIAELLLVSLRQRGVSVVFPDETIWFTESP